MVYLVFKVCVSEQDIVIIETVILHVTRIVSLMSQPVICTFVLHLKICLLKDSMYMRLRVVYAVNIILVVEVR